MDRSRVWRTAVAVPSIATLILAGTGLAAAAAAAKPASAPIAPAVPTRPTAKARPSARRVGGPHLMPKIAPGPHPDSAPAGAHLTYYGGRVISNVQVQQVMWGSGSYEPEVQRTSHRPRPSHQRLAPSRHGGNPPRRVT